MPSAAGPPSTAASSDGRRARVRRGSCPPDPVGEPVLSGGAGYQGLRRPLPEGRAAVTGPARAFAAVRALTGVQLPPAFAGDRDYRLGAVRPANLAGRRAAAAVLA